MNLDEARRFLEREFPQATCVVEAIGPGTATVAQPIGYQHLRPGDTVSGPTMMMLADCAAFFAILGKYGKVALAVTTGFNINFLRKPAADRSVVADCNLLKAGKRLVVCEIHLYSDGLQEPVAHATATYSIPPS
ncbi:MAG: PaaI family thioesterase [Gammaproteobacteria bacterium]|nr:PaaI family thioesterase [Gammaproteobacteria bacterium]MYD75284.1 PaaI family thioesterase [Gammaproteobacteria bacterium]MYJ52543.1 PaaI family thioesterase [Gammaproteobacteria bacterium]